MQATSKEGQLVYVLYRCRWCEKAGQPGFVRRFTYEMSKYGLLWDPARPMVYPSITDRPCPTCNHTTRQDCINGQFVADQTCGPKCVNAIGPTCACQCGGANHGSHYSFHFEATA